MRVGGGEDELDVRRRFIFATTDPHVYLPATVQSRCERYDFRRIALRQVVERLRQIVAADRVEIGDRALYMSPAKARAACAMRSRCSIRCWRAVGNADVLDTLAIADRRVIGEIADAIGRDPAKVLQPLDEVYQRGLDMRRFTRDLLKHLPQPGGGEGQRRRIVPDLADEEVATLREQAKRIGTDDCDRAFHVLLEADEEVGRAAYPKPVASRWRCSSWRPCRRYCRSTSSSATGIQERLRGGAGARRRPRRPRRARAHRRARRLCRRRRPARDGHAHTASRVGLRGRGSCGGIRGLRPGRNGRRGQHFRRCALARLDANAAAVTAPRGFRADYLRQDHLKEVETLAGRFFGRPLRIEITAAESIANGSPAAPPRPSSAELTSAAMRNPAVQAAVAILGGEVAEVRERKPRRRED